MKGTVKRYWTTDEVIERMKEKDNEIKRLENLLTAESKESTERFKRIIELQNIIEKIEHTK